jgi:hypothetical protein
MSAFAHQLAGAGPPDPARTPLALRRPTRPTVAAMLEAELVEASGHPNRYDRASARDLRRLAVDALHPPVVKSPDRAARLDHPGSTGSQPARELRRLPAVDVATGRAADPSDVGLHPGPASAEVAQARTPGVAANAVRNGPRSTLTRRAERSDRGGRAPADNLRCGGACAAGAAERSARAPIGPRSGPTTRHDLRQSTVRLRRGRTRATTCSRGGEDRSSSPTVPPPAPARAIDDRVGR